MNLQRPTLGAAAAAAAAEWARATQGGKQVGCGHPSCVQSARNIVYRAPGAHASTSLLNLSRSGQ